MGTWGLSGSKFLLATPGGLQLGEDARWGAGESLTQEAGLDPDPGVQLCPPTPQQKQPLVPQFPLPVQRGT